MYLYSYVVSCLYIQLHTHMYAHMPLYMWTCTHEYTLTLTHTHVQYDIELVLNDCALHPAVCLGVGEDQWAVGVRSLKDQMLWWLLAMS